MLLEAHRKIIVNNGKLQPRCNYKKLHKMCMSVCSICQINFTAIFSLPRVYQSLRGFIILDEMVICLFRVQDHVTLWGLQLNVNGCKQTGKWCYFQISLNKNVIRISTSADKTVFYAAYGEVKYVKILLI